MIRSIFLCSLVLLLTGCSKLYTYRLVTPSQVKSLPADSLKWSYTSGVITEIPVRNDKDEIFRLPVDQRTLLNLLTTEREGHHFRLQSIVVEDNGEGLLGPTTVWRGYDMRQGAERSVMIREVTEMKVWSRIPAVQRIVVK